MSTKLKIGHGYDAHRLIDLEEFSKLYPSRNTDGLILGGISIPYHKRLAGHSDADLAIHAIIDALLGAAGLEDIGCQFPPSDKSYEAISSLILLERTLLLLEKKSYSINNIDLTIIAEKPKLRPYIAGMREALARALKIDIEQINIKATTTEGLGAIGREEGIAAHAVCLLESN